MNNLALCIVLLIIVMGAAQSHHHQFHPHHHACQYCSVTMDKNERMACCNAGYNKEFCCTVYVIPNRAPYTNGGLLSSLDQLIRPALDGTMLHTQFTQFQSQFRSPNQHLPPQNNQGQMNNPGPFNNQGQMNNPGPFNNQGQMNNPRPFNNQGQMNNPGPFNNQGQINNPGPFNNQGQMNNPGPFNNQGQMNNPGPFNNQGQMNNLGPQNNPGPFGNPDSQVRPDSIVSNQDDPTIDKVGDGIPPDYEYSNDEGTDNFRAKRSVQESAFRGSEGFWFPEDDLTENYEGPQPRNIRKPSQLNKASQ